MMRPEASIYSYDWPMPKFTGKERDSESGLDYFGARYYGSALSRFSSPDPTVDGLTVQDPQSWNLYSYVRNRPTRFVDVGGNWATSIHGDLVTAALSGYLSAWEINQLIKEQYTMDADQSPGGQYKHFMSGGKSPALAESNAWKYVADRMDVAQRDGSDGAFSSNGIRALGDAIHTVQDSTSPMHTTSDGLPAIWKGGFWPPTKWGAGLNHIDGENSPSLDWSDIGQAIRLTMAAYMQASPIGAHAHGLTPESFDAEVQKRIEGYVDSYYSNANGGWKANHLQQGAARLCALGNPSACGIANGSQR